MSSNVYNLQRIDLPKTPSEFEDHSDQTHFVPAPCQVACPVGTDAPSYIGYIWEGRLEEAFEAITSTNPFSSICGRVCDAPCEPACRRTSSDGPLQIRNLKRYVMDAVGHRYDPPPAEVTRTETIAIVGSGPAGLVAAHDLAVAGFRVHVYEMTDRPGGMMVWGIPAFRLPAAIIREDIDRLMHRCPGIALHLNTELGRDVSLEELKSAHDAVLITIGSWWGKAMNIPGEDDPRVVDGVGFLRRINDGERPTMPDTVVVVGGGDVAMDASRAALRLPGCKRVRVVYRRGPEDIPAREIELHHAVKEGVEFVYNTQQVAVESRGEGLALHCVRTAPGEPDDDGRRRPGVVAGSEHVIECGLVIAAVGQQGESVHLGDLGMMDGDRVAARWDTMRTDDEKVFAAGDGAFGGSTIVMAMSHGQRAAYYIRAFLEGRDDPLPYRTPFRTRRVAVAQDLAWEKNPLSEPAFFGVGDEPATFPEIEATYDADTARAEAARCYRCDAETGSADYSVAHREDLFSMARTNPADVAKLKAMLDKRLRLRADPFPAGRAATLDDLTFLPANLSRLVIDPYREACKVTTDIAQRIDLALPFFAAGFDDAPGEIRDGIAAGLSETDCGYLGAVPIGGDVPWWQLLNVDDSPEPAAIASVFVQAGRFEPVALGAHAQPVRGLAVFEPSLLEDVIAYALDSGFGFVVLCGSGDPRLPWTELNGPPDLSLIRDAITVLRRLRREEAIDLIWYGGARSGTDAAKLIALGCKAVAYTMPLAFAAGGIIRAPGEVDFAGDLTVAERGAAVANLLRAHAAEASMMARCTGKTRLHNLEPEDLRAISLATESASGIPMPGTRG